MARGRDVIEARPAGDQTELDLVLAPEERDSFSARGFAVTPRRDQNGDTEREAALAQAANGFTVWRSYDEPGGIRDQLYAIARDNPQLVKLEVLGPHGQGREIIALKVTQGARGLRDGSRPAVLYSSLQHAREWISGEVNRRTLTPLRRPLAGQRPRDPRPPAAHRAVVRAGRQPRRLPVHVRRRAAVAQEPARQRRRRQVTTIGDGVDPNRNFDEHFNYDDEGSSSVVSSETYRGPSAGVGAGDAGR